MVPPGGSKAGSSSNKHKNSFQGGKQLAAVAQAAQKRAFLKQKAPAAPSTGAASTLAATIAAAITSPAAANSPIQPPPVVPQTIDPSPSTSLPQQQSTAASNAAGSKGQPERAIPQNNASTQPETKPGRQKHLPGDSLASNLQMPPFSLGSTSLEDKRTQQYASTSAASAARAQYHEQPYASTSSERQAQHPSQSYASTSGKGKAREQAPTLPDVPPMHSDSSGLSQFLDAINIQVQHPPSSSHFPTCSAEVPPQDFGELPDSWEEYVSQPYSSSELDAYYNELLAQLQSESPASFPPTEPPSLTQGLPIPSSVNVSLGQMPSFTQSNPNPMLDLSQFLEALPGAPLAQQHPHPSSASQPPFSSQAQFSSHSDYHQSSFSTPSQYTPSATGNVGLDGHCAMDCDDDIFLESDGLGGDIAMDTDDQGPPHEPPFHHPSEVRVPSYTTPTAPIETPAHNSQLAQLPSFIPASYQSPTQPLRQTPTFVQDPPYNGSTFERVASHYEPTFMQETPLYRTVPELPKTHSIMDRCNSWLTQAVVSPWDSGIPYTPQAFAQPPSARPTSLPPAPTLSTYWRQAPKARAEPLRNSTNRAAMISSLRAARFVKDIRQSASEQPTRSKWVEINQDYEIQEAQKRRYFGSSMEPSFQQEPASPDSVASSTLSNSKPERDIRPLPSLSRTETPLKFYPITEYNPFSTTPPPALRYYSGVYDPTPVSAFLYRSGQRRKRDDEDSFEDAEGLENGRDHSKRFKASQESDTQHAKPQKKRRMPGHFPLESATSDKPDRKISWRRDTTNCGFCDAIPVVGAFLRFLGMP